MTQTTQDVSFGLVFVVIAILVASSRRRRRPPCAFTSQLEPKNNGK